MRVVLALLTLSFLFIPAPGDAATLRCGNELVSDGASMTDVLLKCGEPMAKETRTETDVVKRKQAGKETHTTTEQVVHKTIEEWTYNFGPHRLIQVVVFENGRLVEVRSGGYGR